MWLFGCWFVKWNLANVIENINKQISWSTKQTIDCRYKKKLSFEVSIETRIFSIITQKHSLTLSLGVTKHSWKMNARRANEKLDASLLPSCCNAQCCKDGYLFLWPGVNQTDLSMCYLIDITKGSDARTQWQQHHKRDKLSIQPPWKIRYLKKNMIRFLFFFASFSKSANV